MGESSNSQTLFSVIIPTFNRNDLLAKCLERLAPGVQSLPPDRYEVIVADDGTYTTAKTMVLEKYPWVTWTAGARKGPAANRNSGARHARGEWLVFADDDCLPDPQWLEAYAEAIANYASCLVFEGRTYVDRPRQSLGETSPVNETGGYLWSCNFAIRRELFESLNGFDERFKYAAMEDVEFGLRLTNVKQSFMFVKSASVCHHWRLKGGWRSLKHHQESTFVYLSIHPAERARINTAYYLRAALHSLIKSTIPGVLRFKGKGIKEEFLELCAFLHMAFLLFCDSRRS